MTYQEGRIGCMDCFKYGNDDHGPKHLHDLSVGEKLKLSIDGRNRALSAFHHIRGDLDGEEKAAVEAGLSMCAYCMDAKGKPTVPYIAKVASKYITLGKKHKDVLEEHGIDHKWFPKAKKESDRCLDI